MTMPPPPPSVASSSHASIFTSLAAHIRGSIIITPWLLYLLAADVALSLLLPVKLVLPTPTYHLCSLIAGSVWAWIQHIFVDYNNANIIVESNTDGATIPFRESAIVVANHVSWTDFYLIQDLAQRAGMLSRCRWFAKKSLRWVPFLGWGLWAMGMPLVSRKWTSDRRELNKVFDGIVQRKWPVWLISYSEGTRFTRRKHASTLSFCESRNLPIPKHTLWPRTRGFVSTVQALRKTSHVRAVYDMTLAYSSQGSFMTAPSFWATIAAPLNGIRGDLSRAGHRFFVRLDRFDLDDLPESDEELGLWLESRWLAKDRKLQELERMWELD
ncbi:hypothetical protein EJ05DRAFT_515053 [Pseudovirgaria hyperparasitica]|uniref:Phospholipid/glycerol acyltransferase domain-containing protein n=1 Tax=Pseudovirgaria hyperparasitica TaxID=470096 RepID=A0A6A6VVF0_9PEZI|nr:uncharacterized protein EJ05DRAFT_515053 [Pseudovirgaria hyperparasitica]KAF2753221.1 hypothetical protein EJ05DRAFT_515053 [Pseudovirgaria hyperparasitica]